MAKKKGRKCDIPFPVQRGAARKPGVPTKPPPSAQHYAKRLIGVSAGR